MKKTLLLFFILLFAGSQMAWAQSRTIKGKVVDEIRNGFPGAGITLKGTSTGTVTDLDGNFEITVTGAKATLVIQAVGYATQEVPATDGMTIRLEPATHELQGTVVTALGIKREKRDLGYSSTTVTSEDLTAGNGTSALSDLAGKVAGANITSSTGGPGGSTRIVLRGEKSFLKDNNALIVIDGVIVNNFDRTQDPYGLAQTDFGNSANDLDPDEIESETVLPGPAAAALYGASAANGAIIITTKHGRKTNPGEKSKLDITYKATYTMSDVLKYPTYQTQYGQGAPGVPDDRGDNFSWGPAFTGQLQPWGQQINGQQLVKPYSYDGNSIKNFFNHGKDLNNFVSLSGGNDNSTYFLSINALNSTQVVPNTFYDKYSIRFNGTTQLTDNFYSSVNVNYINSYSRAENEGQSTGGVMQSLIQIPTDIPINELRNLSDPFYSMDYIDANGVHRFGYFGSFAKNPYWVAQNYDNRNKTNRVLGDATIGYKKGSFNIYDRVGVDATDNESFYETPYINSQSVDQSIYYPSYPYINPGGFSQSDYTGFRFYNDLIANYTHQITKDIGINALLGTNVTVENDQSLSAIIDPGTNGLVIPGFYNFSNNQGPVNVTNATNNLRRYSGYADVNLNYKREIYLELTGRNEWSSTLITNHDSYFYPGANASWIFTERLKGNIKNILDYGKLRAGVAGVSNDAIPYANNSAAYSQGAIATSFGSIIPPFNSVPAYEIGNTFGDKNLKPEITKEYEAGVDLGLLKDRITLSFTYYDDESTNLITAVPVPPSSGYLFNYINVGNISNKGEELSFRATPISTKWGLKWDLFGTYTHNVSDIESLTGGVNEITLSGGGFNGMAVVAAVGHPYGTFYASNYETENGHVVVDATTGLPVPSAKPQLLGSFQPKFQASWGTELSYKGITLHALFVTKQGGEYYSNTKELMDFVGSAPETSQRNPTVWANSVNETSSGTYVTNTTKYLPYNYWVTEVGQGVIPAQNLVDASYVKLQELALSYKIPARYYNKTPFGSLELGVFGNNLLLWTAKSNKYDDPEEMSSGATANAQGFNFNASPSLRNYGVSLKVTF